MTDEKNLFWARVVVTTLIMIYGAVCQSIPIDGQAMVEVMAVAMIAGHFIAFGLVSVVAGSPKFWGREDLANLCRYTMTLSALAGFVLVGGQMRLHHQPDIADLGVCISIIFAMLALVMYLRVLGCKSWRDISASVCFNSAVLGIWMFLVAMIPTVPWVALFGLAVVEAMKLVLARFSTRAHPATT